MGYAASLFDTSSFPARWHCGSWTPLHGWTHVLADLGIASAYIAIPIVLLYFVRARKDIPFTPIFLLFGAFIVLCGFGHLVEAGIFWWPIYRFDALVKLSTAIVSWATVIALIHIAPRALALPGLARVNAELARVNSELSDFGNIVTHDLKAPLRGIRSLTEWLEGDLKEASPECMENLALIRQRVERMEALVNGVFEYSRIGRTDDPLDRVATSRVIHDVMSTIEIPANVRIEFESQLPEVYANRIRLFEVFENLISNAIKYMGPAGGTVRIGARDCGEVWEFWVADTGPGIDPRHHDRIFKMFQRLEIDPRVEGTGLGLAIVKKAVEMRGGKVYLDSELGRGSRFYFTIPKDRVTLPRIEDCREAVGA